MKRAVTKPARPEAAPANPAAADPSDPAGVQPARRPAAGSEPGDGLAEDALATWNFPYEADIHAVSPALLEAQIAWMSAMDSLERPDRKTHELIRMVCYVVLRNTHGVARHARLAAEVGATWEEVAGAIVLTEPSFGLLPAVEVLPWARRGWEHGREAVAEMGDEDPRDEPPDRARPRRRT